jgi:hypothetical protein
MPRSLENWVQHKMNPLHIYCRLIDLGVHEEFSKKCGVFYEKYIYHYLMCDLRVRWNSTGKRSLY